MGTKKFQARMVHWAIDPGDTESGWVQFWLDPSHPSGIKPFTFGKMENRKLRRNLHDFCGNAKDHRGVLCIEMPRAQGMSVANEVFQTCVEIGRFLQTWGGSDWCYCFRGEIKLDICGVARAKDPNVRKALIDIWGGEEQAIGGKKCSRCHGHKVTGKKRKPCELCGGTGWKVPPGPLYGMSKDIWAALAVAISWAKTQERKHNLTPSIRKTASACDRCKVKKCLFRADEYNIGKTPGIDCLAAK